DVGTEVLASELDLGPRLVAAVRDAMTSTGGDIVAAGPIVRERMSAWAADVAGSVAEVVRDRGPAAVVTSVFGVEVLAAVAPACPWAVVNSTFYVGPDPLRALDEDLVPLAHAALAALADRPLRVLLTLGPDHDPTELGSLPPNARAEKTVSHAEVLEHTALLVSDAGHGSVMKALWYGRPMVLVPWGRD